MSSKPKTPEERTRRRMMTDRPFMLEIAYRRWLYEREQRMSATQRAEWDALEPEVHEEWIARAWRATEAYWGMTPAERFMSNQSDYVRATKLNDAALREMP